MASEVLKGSTHFLELFVTNNAGSPATGLTISFLVEKSSDDSDITSGTLTEVGLGWYKTSVVINVTGQYRVTYTTPAQFIDQVEFLKVIEATDSSILEKILGLSQENQRIFDQVYDNFGNMTFARIKIYPTASDVDTDTNEIAEYTFETEYDITRTRSGFIGLAKNVKVKLV